jgi:hypothetical protein
VGEVLEVGATRLIKTQRASQCVEDGIRWGQVTALLQARVVIGAYPGELGHLFPTQPGHPTEGRVRKTDVGWLQFGPASPQVLAELQHECHPTSIRASNSGQERSDGASQS